MNMLKQLDVAIVLTLAATSAQATLIGDTVNCDMQPGSIWACSPASAVVADPGVEFSLKLGTTPFFGVDLSASAIPQRLIRCRST